MNGTDDDTLRRRLRVPEPPARLRAQLHRNLWAQSAQRRRPCIRRYAVVALLALGLSALLLLFRPFPGTELSAVLAAARQHAHDETSLQEIDSTDFARWLKSVSGQAPDRDHLVLFKTCVVDGVTVKHLRLQFADGTSVDLMIDASGRWRNLTAADPRRGWLITHPRANLSLIAVFSPHAIGHVARSVETLFPDGNPATT